MSSERHTVLLVDDSALLRTVLRDVIAGMPEFEVIGTASNGREAIEAVRALAPDVVTLDVEMPGMDGLTVIREARKLSADLRVIIITGYSTEASAIEAINLGVSGYLTKPFRLRELRLERRVVNLCEHFVRLHVAPLGERDALDFALDARAHRHRVQRLHRAEAQIPLGHEFAEREVPVVGALQERGDGRGLVDRMGPYIARTRPPEREAEPGVAEDRDAQEQGHGDRGAQDGPHT